MNTTPAFPAPAGVSHITEQGMTLRDYFAAKAMQEQSWEFDRMEHMSRTYDRAAWHCYQIADAMMKAREHDEPHS